MIAIPNILSLIALVLIAATVILFFVWVQKPLNTKLIWYAAGCAVVAVGMLAVPTQINNSLVFTDSGDKVVTEHSTYIIWDDVEIVPVTERPTVLMNSPHPITKNPKVRNLQYRVSLTMSSDIDDYSNYHKIQSFGGINKWLRYQLYEFNEKYSKKISKFYNPISDTQQTKFQNLVSSFLNKKLTSTGFRFDAAHFSFPEPKDSKK